MILHVFMLALAAIRSQRQSIFSFTHYIILFLVITIAIHEKNISKQSEKENMMK